MYRTIVGRLPRLPLTRNHFHTRQPIPTPTRPFSNGHQQEPTKIEKILLSTIKATGPVSFSTYMQLCLSFPEVGYYMNPDNPIFGRRGDFVTSPEITQVFGELLGIWLVSRWREVGSPPSIRLVELGPGRGTLMADVLRVINKFTSPGTLKSVHLVETSPHMRKLQRDQLRTTSIAQGWELQWHDTLEDLNSTPEIYTMFLAHEFFDALPIHVLQRKKTGWHEVLIGVRHDSEVNISAPPSEDRSPANLTPKSFFAPFLTPAPSISANLLAASSSRFKDLPVGAQIEVSPASFRVAHTIARLLAVEPESDSSVVRALGGCGLIVDYGSDSVANDSFRAFKGHKQVDIFHQPGFCDLTVDVDFAYLREAMGSLVQATPVQSQGNFLLNMGLRERQQALVAQAREHHDQLAVQSGINRLVDAKGMGGQYKVMGVSHEKAALWPLS